MDTTNQPTAPAAPTPLAGRVAQAEFFMTGITLITAQPEDSECSICYDHLGISVVQLTGACNHIFHSTCILTWLQGSTGGRLHNTCPYCRRELYDNHHRDIGQHVRVEPPRAPGQTAALLPSRPRTVANTSQSRLTQQQRREIEEQDLVEIDAFIDNMHAIHHLEHQQQRDENLYLPNVPDFEVGNVTGVETVAMLALPYDQQPHMQVEEAEERPEEQVLSEEGSLSVVWDHENVDMEDDDDPLMDDDDSSSDYDPDASDV
ncbi:hypothetical protein PTNB85_03953 [Pyrenophora teres f. teres]|uniref:RING-type domain-containing protein n=1 Tax=Pyrenophora teres f. teres TaxID=97479 RepID=A0A6S6W0X8_9PLEO|nr:hypothetical protein HRS9139_05495 [Pyrenophora teres f. teres]KAE8840554.1 hypothetical protein PTNB85_03953 [Pyrenophora teres f. teres]KAE8864051.1 hypothetical protein PTNB29_04015 [Pyrenophora teres f. teres]CAE7032990.1 hypothetical protein PTTW11_05117 [Pyrenophora teres f. teres]